MLFLSFALAGESAALSYLGPAAYGEGHPRWTGKANPSVTEATVYTPGADVFVATANANLRDGPGTEHDVVAKLALGSPVKVFDANGEDVVIGQRVDRWYRVSAGDQQGYLFGGTLTPLAAKLDLDGKPGDEVITVAWRWDFALVVRTGPADGSSETVETMTFGGERKGGVARLLTVQDAKVAVVQVDLGSWETTGGTVWYHAMGVENGKPVEHASTYAHRYAGGTFGYLAFEGSRICSAFGSRKKSDRCVDRKTGATVPNVPSEELTNWTRIPESHESLY